MKTHLLLIGGPAATAAKKRFVEGDRQPTGRRPQRGEPDHSARRRQQRLLFHLRQPLQKPVIMPQKTVFCLASSRTQADHIVERLKAAHFSSNDISALFEVPNTSHGFALEKQTRAPDGAFAGAGFVGILGGALGWIAGIGVLVIPGFGSVTAAGPILAALSGAALGAVVGGLCGALIGMVIPVREATHDRHKLKDGNILISVHTQNAAETTQAEVIFAHSDAQGIGTAGEAPTPAMSYLPKSVIKGPVR